MMNSAHNRPRRSKKIPLIQGDKAGEGEAATALLPGEFLDLPVGVVHFLDLFGVEAQ